MQISLSSFQTVEFGKRNIHPENLDAGTWE